MPQSSWSAARSRSLDFRSRFRLTVIAVYRRGHALTTRLGDLPLRVGDVLLLQGRPGVSGR